MEESQMSIFHNVISLCDKCEIILNNKVYFIMFNLFFEASLFGIENKTKEKYFEQSLLCSKYFSFVFQIPNKLASKNKLNIMRPSASPKISALTYVQMSMIC